jgi:hypothetical protein
VFYRLLLLFLVSLSFCANYDLKCINQHSPHKIDMRGASHLPFLVYSLLLFSPSPSSFFILFFMFVGILQLDKQLCPLCYASIHLPSCCDIHIFSGHYCYLLVVFFMFIFIFLIRGLFSLDLPS